MSPMANVRMVVKYSLLPAVQARLLIHHGRRAESRLVYNFALSRRALNSKRFHSRTQRRRRKPQASSRALFSRDLSTTRRERPLNVRPFQHFHFLGAQNARLPVSVTLRFGRSNGGLRHRPLEFY